MVITEKQKEIEETRQCLRKDIEQLKTKHQIVTSRFEQGVRNE